MAQLRDSSTSELIAAGEPLDLLLVADELGHDAVLWDDVAADEDGNPRLDFGAMRERLEEILDGLEGDDRTAEKKRRREIVGTVKAIHAVASSANAPGATLPHVEIG